MESAVSASARRSPAHLASAFLLAGVACSSGAQVVAPPPVVDIAVPAATGAAEAAEEEEAPVADDGMVWIAGGSFMMGSEGCDSDEKPVHKVVVRGFFLDAGEVTTEAYEGCARAGRCDALERAGRADAEDDEARCNAGKADRADHPMNCVTWAQADRFCKAHGKRLPTEQEWEYAARGAKGRAYPWGDTFEAERACWDTENGTCPGGSHRGGDTPEGLTDMAGNVWEWTADHYCEYETPGCADAGYVDRGGGWVSDDPRLLHSAHRGRGEPESYASYLGFRCARER